VTLVVLLGTVGLGAATWRPDALSQPRYTGLLVNANSLIGSAQDIVARFDAYRASLEDLVSNVGTLYSTLSALPAPGGTNDSVAFLHVSDLHLNPAGFDLVHQVVDQFKVDAVLDTGDITDWGSPTENRLIGSVGTLGVPYIYIRGNHDSVATGALIASEPNATVLDDSAVTVKGIEIVGARDPRFTPDKTTGDDNTSDATLREAGNGLAAYAETLPTPPAIAMVHDPKEAAPLEGVAPLLLAGHTHQRKVTVLPDGTRLMVEGSTGGAGLRGLQGKYPEPLTCTVLYLDPATGALRAYDEVTLGGLGETEVTIQRTVVQKAPQEAPAGSGDGTTAPASPTG
jgi:predicted MPP superfamily phosphohydrolase